MNQDDFADALPPDVEPHRSSFGGLGRGPAALLLAAGLLIGGGIGGFVVANASSPISTLASTTQTAPHACHSAGITTAT